MAVQSTGCQEADSVAVLIHQARSGSLEALGRLLERYRDYLLLIAQSELDFDLRSKGGPSDLVQETFLEAQRDFQQFQGANREEVARWLRGLLRNNIGDFVRRYRRAERRRVGRELALDAGEAEAWEASLPADWSSPDERVAAEEQRELLLRAVEQLPADYRRVIMLRHNQKGSWAVVAAQMGRSEGAVQKLWARAVEKLRGHFSGDQ